MALKSIAARDNRLIRKAQDAVVFATQPSTAAIEAITDDTMALITIPTEWNSLGHHTEEQGLNWTREVENSDVRSHGSNEPTRRDIVSDVSGLTMTAQETKMQTLEMFHNIDLSNVEADATSGEVAFNRATTPATRYYRLLAIAQDGGGSDAIYFGRFLPRVSITDYSEQSWTKSGELQYQLTMTAYVDDTLGYAMREMWGGPGLPAVLDAMGFTQATA